MVVKAQIESQFGVFLRRRMPQSHRKLSGFGFRFIVRHRKAPCVGDKSTLFFNDQIVHWDEFGSYGFSWVPHRILTQIGDSGHTSIVLCFKGAFCVDITCKHMAVGCTELHGIRKEL